METGVHLLELLASPTTLMTQSTLHCVQESEDKEATQPHELSGKPDGP